MECKSFLAAQAEKQEVSPLLTNSLWSHSVTLWAEPHAREAWQLYHLHFC
jgi:hypothetical protein